MLLIECLPTSGANEAHSLVRVEEKGMNVQCFVSGPLHFQCWAEGAGGGRKVSQTGRR